MESGSNKLISDVYVGDRVLAFSTKTQSTDFSTVVAVPHNKNNKIAEFVQITTESGKVIKLTSEHFIQSSMHWLLPTRLPLDHVLSLLMARRRYL